MGWTVRFPVGASEFSLLHSVQTVSEAHPASYPEGTWGFSPELKRLGHQADQSPSSITFNITQINSFTASVLVEAAGHFVDTEIAVWLEEGKTHLQLSDT
jgi:hypothetical protein